MPISVDPLKARQLIQILFNTFQTDGIFGQNEMPEDLLPKGIERGSLDHLLFITLTVAIDYQRDAIEVWNAARKTFEDPTTRYLYNPQALHETAPNQIRVDMQKYGLSKKPEKDAHIWRTNGVTFYKKWNGNPIQFVENCGWDAPTILERLRADTHLFSGRPAPDFPFLRGDKIGPLWIRMLRDNVGIDRLERLEKVPIPVDIHIARASLCLGVVTGDFKGGLLEIFRPVREAWAKGVEDLNYKHRPMIALDVDEPLWHLSKYGCVLRTKEDNSECPKKEGCAVKQYCVTGKISIMRNKVALNT